MTTIKIGDKIEIISPKGKILKTIGSIFWRKRNEGRNAIEKIEVLLKAKNWCIFIFDDGTWLHGTEILNK